MLLPTSSITLAETCSEERGSSPRKTLLVRAGKPSLTTAISTELLSTWARMASRRLVQRARASAFRSSLSSFSPPPQNPRREGGGGPRGTARHKAPPHSPSGEYPPEEVMAFRRDRHLPA